MLSDVLDSIYKQTYANWECLVVDDGSGDTSKKVVAQWIKKDARFQWHERPSTSQKGANACRNFGFEQSKGAYINWFDSDDLMLPLKLAQQVAQLTESNYFYSICQTERYDAVQQKSFGLRAEAITSKDPLNDYVQFSIFWTTGAALWKKSFIQEHNLRWDEDLQQSQDYDFHIRALAISTAYGTIDTALMQLLRHEQNMSNAVLDAPDKILSNVKARYKALKFQQDVLTIVSKRELFNKMYYFFRTTSIARNIHTSNQIFSLLKQSKTHIVGAVSLEKGIFNRWKFGMYLYAFTGKGERFLKPNKE